MSRIKTYAVIAGSTIVAALAWPTITANWNPYQMASQNDAWDAYLGLDVMLTDSGHFPAGAYIIPVIILWASLIFMRFVHRADAREKARQAAVMAQRRAAEDLALGRPDQHPVA